MIDNYAERCRRNNRKYQVAIRIVTVIILVVFLVAVVAFFRY